MPKETKKFINPLLRPSQNAEVKPAQPSQPDIVNEPVGISAMDASSKRPETPFEPTAKAEPAQSEIVQPFVAPKDPPARQSRSTAKGDEKTLPADELPTGSARRGSTTGPLAAKAESQSGERSRSRQSSAEPINLSSDESVLEESYANYDPTISSEDSRAAARRRRSLQPFETTHERITLWMDKQLKQRFEALAYQRELPKTALINEAVSALLEKYEAR